MGPLVLYRRPVDLRDRLTDDVQRDDREGVDITGQRLHGDVCLSRSVDSLGSAGSVQHQGAVFALQSELLEQLVSDDGCIATLVQHHVNENATAIRGEEVSLGCPEGYRICGRTLMGVEGPRSRWCFVEQRVVVPSAALDSA